MANGDDHAARIARWQSLYPDLEDLHAETQRLYAEITARTIANRTNNASLPKRKQRVTKLKTP
jgi:hypothetical protein